MYNNSELRSVRQIAVALDIKHESVLRRWIGKEHTVDEYKKRARKEKKEKLTSAQQQEMREWDINQCNNFTPAKIEDIQDHVHNTYHW